MSTRDYLHLRFEAPLQSWGDVALDPQRPTGEFPRRSAIAGMIASALGWRYSDGDRTTALQDAIEYAVREDRVPAVMRDFQTVDLGREPTGWTRWGVESRGGASATGTHVLEKYYLADGSFLIALTLGPDAPADLDEVTAALERPARPLFLGRRSCPPAVPILEGRCSATSLIDALRAAPLRGLVNPDPDRLLRCWLPQDAAPEGYTAATQELWDRREFERDVFRGYRRIALCIIPTREFAAEGA